MKILIAYFSGTGNTYYCAEYLKERLEKDGHGVSLRAMERLAKAEVPGYDILIAGFPVFVFDMPELVKDFFTGLPLTVHRQAYLFGTKGFYAGNALRKAAGVLRANGYRISAAADVTMPGSDALVMLREGSSFAKKLCAVDFKTIAPLDKLIGTLRSDLTRADGTCSFDRTVPARLPGAILDGVIGPFYPAAKRSLVRKLHADEACTRCGLCEEICPEGNIRLTEQGVRFGENCLLCLRCVNQCPVAAIQIGKGTAGKLRWKGPYGRFDPLKREEP